MSRLKPEATAEQPPHMTGSHRPKSWKRLAPSTWTLARASFSRGAQRPSDEAVKTVRAQNKASISLVQRVLRIGYNRAAGLLEGMEKAGVVSAMSADGRRMVLS